jgi:hypothetical protein
MKKTSPAGAVYVIPKDIEALGRTMRDRARSLA